MADAQTIETRCSECGSRYRVAARFIGQSVTCQKCRKPFTVRAQEPVTLYPVLGRLAISYRFISEGDLKSALDFQQNQAREGVTQTLASILVNVVFSMKTHFQGVLITKVGIIRSATSLFLRTCLVWSKVAVSHAQDLVMDHTEPTVPRTILAISLKF